jgi:hypothetical protein
MLMLEEKHERERAATDNLEFRKGCPVCEHSDPALERALQTLAQLLFDIYLAQHEDTEQPGPEVGIDNVR